MKYVIKRLNKPENESYLRFAGAEEYVDWGSKEKAERYKTRNAAKVDLRDDEIVIEVKEE